ncbi:hypothetical protein Pcinc_024873 [Petrolisthes cinctipes]|uniref:Uncharacterized protein n=1 Tax=Petrolisthes cinctipes TaxID=88211 RepID=A0AAE1KEM6_PETCI|nr:hypothetical protein Pcinc_024873 [Petrolisthes cinctipes]
MGQVIHVERRLGTHGGRCGKKAWGVRVEKGLGELGNRSGEGEDQGGYMWRENWGARGDRCGEREGQVWEGTGLGGTRGKGEGKTAGVKRTQEGYV